MFKALWIKHWAQLRTLRWVGFGLGIALPLILWAGAAAGKRGWFGFSVRDYDLATLFGDALPAVAAMLWGLLAVMFAAQTFTGDRADGTERFLLDRPVPRRRTWLAGLTASLTSTLIVAAGHAFYVAALVTLVSEGPAYGRISTQVWIGVGLAVLGTIGGMAASDVVRTPMQAVLIGLVFTALPIGVATFFASVFPLARFDRDLHLGVFLTAILPISLILMSYRAGCFGEPAGRGRVKRSLTVLAVALVLTPALFAATAPLVVRSTLSGGWPEGTAPAADRTVLLGGGYRNRGGTMLDTSSGERIRFLAPPIRSVAWNDDGSMLAVIHQSGVLGSVGPVRLELIDPSGTTRGSFVLEDDDSFALDVHWAGRRVLVRERHGFQASAIRVIDAQRGVVGSIAIDGDEARTWKLLGPTTGGDVFLHRLVGQDPRVYELNRIDLERLRLDEPSLIETDDLPTFAAKLLSPSGRYLARVRIESEVYASHVYDLQSGLRTDYPESMIAGWLSGDRLIRLEKEDQRVRLVVQGSDGEELLSRVFDRSVAAKPSPDAERFFVTRRAEKDRWFGYGFFASLRGDGLDELLVCDGTACSDLGSLIDALEGDNVWIAWGGPNTLVSTDGHRNAVAEARSGALWTAVAGR